jgi:hypothetical protein
MSNKAIFYEKNPNGFSVMEWAVTEMDDDPAKMNYVWDTSNKRFLPPRIDMNYQMIEDQYRKYESLLINLDRIKQ